MASMDIKMGDYDNSMNFAFGLKGRSVRSEGFDILNNPYVRFVGLEKTDGTTYHEKYEFEQCSDEFKLRFMQPNQVEEDWYPQLICFKDRENVSILKNQYMVGHKFPAVVTAYCRNTTENGDWCASQEEIDEWLLSHRKQLVY